MHSPDRKPEEPIQLEPPDFGLKKKPTLYEKVKVNINNLKKKFYSARIG